MKKIYLIVLLCIATASAYAQQEPLFAQYFKNPMLYNAGACGATQQAELRIYHRWQWVSFPGSPVTFGINYQSGYKRSGFGADLHMDKTGPSQHFGGQLSYAYHIPISKQSRLALGITGRFLRYEIDTRSIHFNDPTDVIASAGVIGRNRGEASAGLYYYTPRVQIGLASTNLLQTSLDIIPEANNVDKARYYRHFWAMAKAQLGKGPISYEPNVLLKFTGQTPLQYEAGMRLQFKEHDFGFGVGYRGADPRSPGFITFNFNTLFDKQFPILIGVDIATGKFGDYSGFSYEMMLGADFMRNDMISNYSTVPATKK